MHAEFPKGRNGSDAKVHRVWDFDKFVLAHGDLIETNARSIALEAREKPLSSS